MSNRLSGRPTSHRKKSGTYMCHNIAKEQYAVFWEVKSVIWVTNFLISAHCISATSVKPINCEESNENTSRYLRDNRSWGCFILIACLATTKSVHSHAGHDRNWWLPKDSYPPSNSINGFRNEISIGFLRPCICRANEGHKQEPRSYGLCMWV
jgi:hypothetical protein